MFSRFHHLLLLLPIPLALALGACGSDEKYVEPGFDIRVGDDGKADGLQTILDAEDLARLEEAFDSVIREGQATIDALEAEIAQLESENQAKADEIGSLVSQMESRRRELERQRDNNAILCVFFPNPSTCLLAVIIDNDSRMNSLERKLNDARSRQRQINEDIANYEQERDQLREELAPIRESRDRLIALYRSGTDGHGVPEGVDFSELGSQEEGAALALAYVRQGTLDELSTATREEIAILVEIRNNAGELAQRLDVSLETIRALADSVDELVDDSKNQFMDMLEALLTGDPEAFASKFLEDAIAARTREILRGLDWPEALFVEHLIDNRGDEGANLDDLAEKILGKLLAEEELPSLRMSSEVALSILDNTELRSLIEVPEFNTTRAEISVDIEHTWVGDLEISLQIGEERILLRDRSGGSADDIRETYVVDFESAPPVGEWFLVVEDHVSWDEGRLLGWDLLLHQD